MLNWLKENAVPVERASKLSDEERKETFVTGIFADKKGQSFLSRYGEIQSRARRELERE